MHAILRLTTIALALVPAAAGAQSVPEITLSAPTARSTDGLSDIVRVHEQRDGRLLAVDLRERRIVLIDLERRAMRDIARQGEGPREFTGAFSLIPWLGDTVLVYGRRDFLKISPTGEPVERIGVRFSLPVVTVGNVRATGGLTAPHYADREGRIYFETTNPLTQGADGAFIPPLHGKVVRWDPRADTADVVVPSYNLRDSTQALVPPWRPYPARDATAALPDGRVMVVRATPMRAELWRDGKLLGSGPVQARTAIPVGDAERNAFRDARARRPAGMASATGGNSAEPTRTADREAVRRSVGIPDEAFPRALPPFVEERATLVDLTGRVWVARSYAVADAARRYDVYDDRGTLVQRVVVPNRGRIVGFGRGTVYVATPDSDDIEWVERYAMR